MRKYLILFFAYFFYCIVCMAQQVRFYGSLGLSCSFIKNIVQDADGFIWIGTEYGLNKFDGWTYTNYFHNDNDTTSLLNNIIESLLCDKDGNLWVGSGYGVQQYSSYENSFKNVRFIDGNRPSVLRLHELSNGEIWAVTAGYGVYSINKKKMEAKPVNEVNRLCNTRYIHNLYQDSKNRIWVGLPNDKIGVISSDLSKIEFIDTLGLLGKVFSFLEDREKKIWLAASFGVYYWNDNENKLVKMEQSVSDGFLGINGMICTNQGELYVNTSRKGLFYVNREGNRIEPTTGKLDFKNDRVYALMEDRRENLWLGSLKNGIVMFSKDVPWFKFSSLSSLGLPEKNIISFIYLDRNNKFWISASDGCLIQTDENMENLRTYNFGGFLSMLYDRDGVIWLGGYNGVSNLDQRTGNIKSSILLNYKAINNIVEGDGNIIYFSVIGNGFVEYNKTTGELKSICDTTELNSSVHLRNNWINKMIYDTEGLLWLAHCSGINCYNPQRNEFIELGCEETLRSILCYSLLEDKRGNIWIGTNNGLFEYDKKEFKLIHYDMDDGLPSNVICGLGQNSDGDIWCSTFNGLCRLSYKDKRITNIFLGNGLEEKEYIRGVYFQNGFGEIYLGGLNGITMFMPDSVEMDLPLNPPTLTRVYLYDKEINANVLLDGSFVTDTLWSKTKNINLNYRNNSFSFEFSTLEFHNKNNIKFEYRLLGVDNTWRSTLSGINRITYNYLPSGKYIMEVRVCENDCKSPVRTINIYVAPPWYSTLLAKIVYFCIILGIVCFTFYAWSMRQKRRRNAKIADEKLKFFINIAHELRSPITLIVSPLASLIKMECDDNKRQTLLTMQRNANRILNLINQLLDIRKIDKGLMKMNFRETDMVDFIQSLIEAFDYQSNKRNIRLVFIHQTESLNAWIDRNNFDKVLINLIVNAFKYTPDNGEITIELIEGTDNNAKEPMNHYVEICVSDTGIGLDEKKLTKIFDRFYQISDSSQGFGIGLNLAKMLVELHHGTIMAFNRKDKQGSCFRVRIPYGKEHLKREELFDDDLHVSNELALSVANEDLCLDEDSKHQTSKSKTRFNVLVVDDDEEIREYLRNELGKYYRVIAESNGVDAYKVALTKKIDLIISDVVMPEMGGFEFLEKIKNNANTSHIPFIILTSQAEYDSRLKGWNVGADAFMPKPFQIEELNLLCDSLIRNRIRYKGYFKGYEVNEKMAAIEVKANDDYFMERIMKAINDNFGDPKFGVEDLAEAVGVSRVQLHRKLKAMTGSSTSEFIRNIRLKQAAKLLKEKKVNISQVAYIVGFTNPALFSIAFKRFYGRTPSEYAENEIEE